MTLHLPPRILSAVREPEYPKRIRRVARYGPMEIVYDCELTAADGETNRDVIRVSFTPDDWSGPGRVKDPDKALNAALDAIQAALGITFDELIESAPKREDCED